jgi:hypothetical protein
MRGEILTVYFTESGFVRHGNAQQAATVTSAEIHYCWDSDSKQGKSMACCTISRISGRFSLVITGTTVMTRASGSCMAESQKPKF